MLAKSLASASDTLIYDLEDSVAPGQKETAREQLLRHLDSTQLSNDRFAIRINALNTPYFARDISQVVNKTNVRTLVMPKVHSGDDLNEIASHLPFGRNLNVIASIESARALWNIGEIASRSSGNLKVIGLLFAAEDYCADTGIIRTKSRQELLYTRSKVVAAAKAFGLRAVDMVCVDYKDEAYLREECEDGRRLGFDGKQAIHPNQVEVIQSTFVPTAQEILRAVRILTEMERARTTESRGAFGLAGENGTEMIDEPMVKQAEGVLLKARAAGLPIPDVPKSSP